MCFIVIYNKTKTAKRLYGPFVDGAAARSWRLKWLAGNGDSNFVQWDIVEYYGLDVQLPDIKDRQGVTPVQ